MFKFFTKRWVGRKEFEEKEQELKSVKLVIEGKEKAIQRLESMLMDGEQGKGIPVQEISRNAVFVLDEKQQIKQILDFKKEQDEGIISSCIEELKKSNERLEDYSPSNPELAGLDVRDVVFRLALEMRVQNSIMVQALLALNLKKLVNIENNA